MSAEPYWLCVRGCPHLDATCSTRALILLSSKRSSLYTSFIKGGHDLMQSTKCITCKQNTSTSIGTPIDHFLNCLAPIKKVSYPKQAHAA